MAVTNRIGRPSKDVMDRIQDWVHVGDGCWEWLGTKTYAGYGQLVDNEGRAWRAHRFVYEWLKGPIPEGLTLDHLCRNRLCVNPGHLDPCTAEENRSRARQPVCRRGHAKNMDGPRKPCNECKRLNKQASKTKVLWP